MEGMSNERLLVLTNEWACCCKWRSPNSSQSASRSRKFSGVISNGVEWSGWWHPSINTWRDIEQTLQRTIWFVEV
jgi:hypothetical protein